MAEKSERTKKLEEAKIEDDPLYVKRALRGLGVGMSRAADKMGFTQDDKKQIGKGAMGAAGAGVGATAGAAASKGMQGLAEAMKNKSKSKSKMDTKEFEVPTDENMNRPKATRPGGPRNLMDDFKEYGMKKGGMVSASKRADGCAVKGKTKGRMV